MHNKMKSKKVGITHPNETVNNPRIDIAREK
jgi:hypothetical protein